ncbi:MAG TPA: hypothetical protein VL371_08170 [Gemmataceae bacterium]|jgi:hypothetical protein|nr:hypothetical protein [Gemmataceae bacterium]
MFASLWSTRQRIGSRPRPVVNRPRLSLESLEDRTVPSSGPGGGSGLITGTPGGSGTAVIQTSGGSGSTSGGSGSTPGGSGSTSGGSLFMSGPGYPLAPSTGPTPTSPATTTTDVLVPLCGAPDSTVVVSPVVTA